MRFLAWLRAGGVEKFAHSQYPLRHGEAVGNISLMEIIKLADFHITSRTLAAQMFVVVSLKNWELVLTISVKVSTEQRRKEAARLNRHEKGEDKEKKGGKGYKR